MNARDRYDELREQSHAREPVPESRPGQPRDADHAEVAMMPWGVHSEFSEDEGPEVEIDEEQEGVDRSEEGSETTEDFDIDDAIANLD